MSSTDSKVTRAQGLLPLILFAASAGVWCVLAVRKLGGWEGPMQTAGIAICVAYAAWLLIEARVAAKESSFGSTQRDAGSLPVYAFARIVTVTAALALPTQWQQLGVIPGLGFALLIAGACLRLLAIHTLGRFYSHYVRKLEGHRIVNTGPYRVLRHPAYTGMLLAHLGFVMFFFHPLALALWLFAFVPAVAFRIRVEERSLYELKGYAEFARERARLLPLVW